MGFTDVSVVSVLQNELASFLSDTAASGEASYRFMKHLYLRSAIDAQLSPLNRNRLSQGVNEFRGRIESGIKTIKVYEEAEHQYTARQCVDYERIHLYVAETRQTQLNALTASPGITQQSSDEEIALIALMRWFKCDHFKWCNKPKCGTPDCFATHGNGMDARGVEQPTATEREQGWAGRTEVYSCKNCNQLTRFPRYNNPSFLLKHSPQGRCGEFANAFCLLCRSLGLDARYVLDFTDHVWVEVWIPSLRRFVHCDPCERALDTPLMYEVGWNKKLSHVLSFSRCGVEDASPRYSRKLDELITRRNAEIVSESVAREVIASKDVEMERYFASRYSVELTSQNNSLSITERLALGAAGFNSAVTGFDISSHRMQERKRLSNREVAALTLSTQTTSWKVEEMCGRISGDVDWRTSRGEIGKISAESAVSCDASATAVTAGCASEQPSDASTESSGEEGKAVDPPEWFVSGMICRQQTASDLIVTHSAATDRSRVFLNTIALPYAHQVTRVPHQSQGFPSIVAGGKQQPIFSTHRTFIDNSSIKETNGVVVCGIVGFVCSTPCDLLTAAPGESPVDLISRAKDMCHESSTLMGFSLSRSAPPTHAFLFSRSGYPLVKRDGSPPVDSGSGVELTDIAVETDAAPPLGCVFSKHFLYLGGGQHGDTQCFDTTLFLDSLVGGEENSLHFARGLKLNRVIVTAGANIVNGIQCVYTDTTTSSLPRYTSPPFTSTNDHPVAHIFEIPHDDCISRVAVKHGSLIDSVTLTTRKGVVFRAGGSGGGETSVIDIPENQQLCGFFGGTGGHLHNLGVVLSGVSVETQATPSTSTPSCDAAATNTASTVTKDRLKALCDALKMEECGLLSFHSESTPLHPRHSDVSSLVAATMSLITANSAGDVRTSLGGVAAYVENIRKDLREPKTQTIRLTNAYLHRSVLVARGGLQMLCFGPAGFRLSRDCSSLEAGVREAWRDGGDRAELGVLLKAWLGKYAEYLRAVCDLLSS
eukprot:gene28450-35303_t